MVYTEKNIRFKRGLIKAVRELNPCDEHVVMLYWNNGYVDFKVETYAEACYDNRKDKLFVINDGNKASRKKIFNWIKDYINCWN